MKRFLMYGISKSLLIKIILALLILLGVKDVFALEIDVTNSITSPETSGTGKYRGTEILNTGAQATYNVKTRYQGRLSRIIYNLPLPSELGSCFSTNVNYTITMYMETNDWNNKFGTVKVKPYSSYGTNWSNGNVTYVNYKKIYFTFKIPSSETTCYDFVWVDLPSTNLSSTGITQISNWNLSKVTLNDPTINTGGSGGSGGSTPTPTPDSSQAIINNQNQNTQSIIENQDNNTQDIISSIQETTGQVSQTIENTFTNKCTNLLDLTDYEEISSDLELIAHNGTLELHSENPWANVKYKIPLERNKTYYFKGNFISLYPNHSFLSLSFDGNDIVGQRFFNYEPFQASGGIQNGIWETSFNSGSNDYVYLGIWVNKSTGGNSTTYLNMMFDEFNLNFCPFGTTQSNKIDELNSKLDGIQNAINDDSLPEVDIDLEMASDTPISDLLLLPINLLDKVRVSLEYSCTPYRLPFGLWGGNEYIDLPCIDLKDYLGNDVTNVIDYILCFYIAYQIALFCISIYNNITSLDDGFNALYEPEHAAPDGAGSYIGRHGGGAR